MVRVGLFGFSVAVALVACGGKSKPTPVDNTTGAGSGSDDAGITNTATITEPTTQPDLPPTGSPLDLLHAQHAIGTARMQDVCNQLTGLTTKTAAVRAGGVPKDLDDGAWSSALAKIEDGLVKMKSPCGGTDLHKFEDAFSKVHWAFHDFMDLVVGDHGHGDGEGGGGRRGIPK
jgi:hypothetical protein